MRWFGHVETIDEIRMARRALMPEVCEGRVRGRTRFGWIDGIKVGVMAEAAQRCAKDRKEWRALVHM